MPECASRYLKSIEVFDGDMKDAYSQLTRYALGYREFSGKYVKSFRLTNINSSLRT